MNQRIGASIIDAITHQTWNGDTHSLILDMYYDQIDQIHPLIFAVKYENKITVDAVWGGGITIEEAEVLIKSFLEKENQDEKFN